MGLGMRPAKGVIRVIDNGGTLTATWDETFVLTESLGPDTVQTLRYPGMSTSGDIQANPVIETQSIAVTHNGTPSTANVWGVLELPVI